MEKQKTALQELKDELLVLLEVCETMSNNKSPDSPDQLLGSHGVGLISGIIMKLDEKLPLEKEQIEEAWNDANGHSFYEYGSEYYTNTYTDEKDTTRGTEN